MSSKKIFFGETDSFTDLLNERTENIDLKFIQCLHIPYTHSFIDRCTIECFEYVLITPALALLLE